MSYARATQSNYFNFLSFFSLFTAICLDNVTLAIYLSQLNKMPAPDVLFVLF